VRNPINLERSFAMDDSCQMMFWAKGHHSWGDFIAAVEAELQTEERTDIPEWVICQAPVKQIYQRSVPCSGNIVADRQFIYQNEPGRGATAVTVMNFWFPIHADRNRRAQPAEEVQPVGVFYQDLAGLYHQVQPAVVKHYPDDPGRTPLYTRPPAAEADRLDAERYRFMRDQHWHSSDLFVVQGGKSKVSLGSNCPSGELLDQAIDAALAASKEKKE